MEVIAVVVGSAHHCNRKCSSTSMTSWARRLSDTPRNGRCGKISAPRKGVAENCPTNRRQTCFTKCHANCGHFATSFTQGTKRPKCKNTKQCQENFCAAPTNRLAPFWWARIIRHRSMPQTRSFCKLHMQVQLWKSALFAESPNCDVWWEEGAKILVNNRVFRHVALSLYHSSFLDYTSPFYFSRIN